MPQYGGIIPYMDSDFIATDFFKKESRNPPAFPFRHALAWLAKIFCDISKEIRPPRQGQTAHIIIIVIIDMRGYTHFQSVQISFCVTRCNFAGAITCRGFVGLNCTSHNLSNDERPARIVRNRRSRATISF